MTIIVALYVEHLRACKEYIDYFLHLEIDYSARGHVFVAGCANVNHT